MMKQEFFIIFKGLSSKYENKLFEGESPTFRISSVNVTNFVIENFILCALNVPDQSDCSK